MRRLSTTTIGMMAWSKRVCVLLVVVSLLFDLSVCLCRPECLSVTGLRFHTGGANNSVQVGLAAGVVRHHTNEHGGSPAHVKQYYDS